MNLTEFRSTLAAHAGRGVRFVFDAERTIADHFHVTEVGRVEKQFVDCGGVRRASVACVLQTLVAGDTDHRLTSDKLAKIVALADSLDLPDDAPVEVEHQERSIAIDQVAGVRVTDELLEFQLKPKQTACLAQDACGLPVLTADDCCDTSGCC